MTINGNINQKANLIWTIADILTEIKTYEYDKVILPMLAMRFHSQNISTNMSRLAHQIKSRQKL